jgi:hypothetical protein
VRIVHRDEFHAAVYQLCDEGKIARQAIKLGNHQLSLLPLASGERLLQLGAVATLATLNLGEFADERPPAAVEVAHDGFAGCMRWFLITSMFKYLLVDHAVPAMERWS